MANHVPAQDPVRLYAGEDMRLPRRLRDRLLADLKVVEEFIVSGGPKTFDHYRERVGVRAGILQAIQACDAFAKELTRGE